MYGMRMISECIFHPAYGLQKTRNIDKWNDQKDNHVSRSLLFAARSTTAACAAVARSNPLTSFLPIAGMDNNPYADPMQ